MRFIGAGLLVVGLLTGGDDLLAQDKGTAPVPPPPVVYVPAPPRPPAPPPSAPGLQPALKSLDDEIARWGIAPAAGPAPAATLDKKILKQLRRDAQTIWFACSNKGPLKSWMVADKLKACDKSLADAPPPDSRWDYRAQLLQHRALALTLLGGYRLALAALDDSDAIGAGGQGDFFAMSTGLGNTMLRAYALDRLGERDRALALIADIRRARSYAPSIQAAADALEFRIDPTPATMRRLAATRATIDPEVYRLIFLMDLSQSQIAEADWTGDQVSFRDPKMRGGWSMVGAPDEAEQMGRQVSFLSLRAYAAAANGNQAKADALLAAGRATIADYVGEDPRIKDRAAREWKMNAYNARVSKGAEMERTLAAARSLISLRKESAALSMDALTGKLKAIDDPKLHFFVVTDLLRQISGSDKAQAALTANMLFRRILTDLQSFDPTQLGELLPKTEYLDQVPRFASSPDPIWLGNISGWSQAKEGDGAIRTVRYETTTGSKAMMEEMLLLASANLARQEGKDAFIILSSRTFSRQTTVSGYFSSGTTYDSGVEAQARIQLLDTANLAGDLAQRKDRIITVAQIERDLRPRYQQYFAAKAALKEARKAK